MEIRNKECDKCSFGDHCREIKAQVCQVGEGSVHSPLMVIAEAPDRDDARSGGIMRSQKDGLLRRILKDAMNLKDGDVYITYLLKCHADRPTTVDDVEACKEYLHAEITAVKPKVILTLGDMALHAMTDGKVSNLTRVRGEIMLKEINGHQFKLIPTLSCGHVLRVQSQFKNFALDVDKAWGEATGVRNKNRRSQHKIIESRAEFREVLEWVKDLGICTFDFETMNLKTHEGREANRATGLAISFQPGMAYFLPLEHFESPFTEKEAVGMMIEFCVNVLENEDVRKIAHNLKYDLHIARLYKPDLRVKGRYDDTMLMSHLYDETTPNGLKDNVSNYFRQFGNYEKALEEFGIKGTKGDRWDRVPLKPLAEYACLDADLTGRLCVLFEFYLLQDERLYAVYRNEVMAAFMSFFEAEYHGMLVDKDFLFDAIKQVNDLIATQEKKLRAYPQLIRFETEMNDMLVGQKLEELNTRLGVMQATRLKKDFDRKEKQALSKRPSTKDLVDTPMTKTEGDIRKKVQELKQGILRMYGGVNFGSHVQLGKLFYTVEGFGFDPIYDKKTNTYHTGTGKEVLIDIKDETGFIEDLQVWRSLSKTCSTYLEAIYEKADKNDYLHTSFKQHGTVSGRISSADPNLQNLPNEGKIKNEAVMTAVRFVKKSLSVPDGYTLIALDYSQMELRLMAEFSGDETMIQAYKDKIDLHALTASKMLGISIEEFYKLPEAEQKKWRTRAKAGNFGLIYGMGAKGFKDYAKQQYGVILSDEESEDTHETFFKTYKRLPEYHELYISKGEKYGYVRTLTGRKRNLPDINSKDDFKKSMDDRAAINSPIQGTGGEMTIFASAVLRHRLDPRVIFVLNIHDANYWYCPDELLDETIPVIKKTCENLPLLKYFKKGLKHVDIVVDIEVSKKNLKETEPYVFPENN